MSLKQRLIGATVLIALAVIFLPMFLDGAGHRERTVQIDIPPEPKFEFEKRLPSLSEISGNEYESIEVRGSESSKVESPSISHDIVTSQASNQADDVGKDPHVASLSPLSPPRPESQFEPEAKKKPLPREVQEGWVVQVGSFKQRSNAVALREKLKAAGYQVIEEKGGTRNIPIYRVKVGPVDKRDRATGLRAKLRKEQRLDGYVAQFP